MLIDVEYCPLSEVCLYLIKRRFGSLLHCRHVVYAYVVCSSDNGRCPTAISIEVRDT
jgi:hypothetical protein